MTASKIKEHRMTAEQEENLILQELNRFYIQTQTNRFLLESYSAITRITKILWPNYEDPQSRSWNADTFDEIVQVLKEIGAAPIPKTEKPNV